MKNLPTILSAICAVALLLSGCESESETPAAAAPAVQTPTAPVAAPQPPANPPLTGTDPPPPAAPITFDPPELNFGILAPATKARGLITMRNTSDRDLRILVSKTSCGCTATTPLDGRVVPAGDTLSFDASMQLKSGLGPKREQVLILFEGYEQSPIRYDLRAEASLPVRAVPPYLKAVETLAGRIDLESRDGTAFRVLSAGGAPPRFVGFDPGVDAPRDRYTIEWDLAALDQAGRVPWYWVVETDHPDSPIVDLRVQHNSTRTEQPRGRPWAPKDLRIVVNTITPGTPVEFEAHIDFVSGMQVPVETATIAGPVSAAARFELVRSWADRQSLWYRVRLTVPAGTPPGPLYEIITLKAAGFDSPLRVIGRISG